MKLLSKYNKLQLAVFNLTIEFVVILSLFLISSHYIEQHVESDIQQNMLNIARYAAHNIDIEDIKNIKHSSDIYFNRIKRQLKQIEKIYQLREGLAYIVEIQNRVPVFSVMTNEQSFRGHRYPEEIVEQIRDVFAGKERISDLYEDRNGTFISVLVPLYDRQYVLAALEIDFPGDQYQEMLFGKNMPFLIGLFLLLMVSFIAIFVILLKLFHTREKEFKQKNLQLIQTEKMALLSRLVAGIAHEVNNPVSVIHSAGDVLNRSIDKITKTFKENTRTNDSPQNNSLHTSLKILKKNNEAIHVASDRIANLVKKLKNFARLDEAKFKQADINHALDTTLMFIRHEIKTSIKIVKKYGNLPRINCYPDQLNQVFMSLLVNASQAIEGQGEIKLTTTADTRKIYIRIHDTGKGIPRGQLSKLFDINFTVKNSRVGLGMGLANACNIIRKHQGNIEVKSEVGEGSEFTVTVPVDLQNQPR
ncbi:MAG: sensor histidine kinase [bacterium]